MKIDSGRTCDFISWLTLNDANWCLMDGFIELFTTEKEKNSYRFFGMS